MPPRKKAKKIVKTPLKITGNEEEYEKIQSWLETVKKFKKKDMVLQPEDMEIFSDASEDDNEKFNIKDFDVT